MNTPKDSITLAGKEWPCGASMGAMVYYKRATGKSPKSFTEDDVEEMAQYVYCCIKAACKAEGIPFDLDFDTFMCQLDPSDMADFFTSLAGNVSDAEKKKNESTPEIDELMGMAVGAMGMSMPDFMAMTPEEFNATFKAWDTERQGAWERARLIGWCAVMPYSQERKSPTEFMPFPWDKDTTTATETLPKPSEEDVAARLEAAKKRWNLK